MRRTKQYREMEARRERLIYRAIAGLQIPILSLSTIARAATEALGAGKSDDEIVAAVRAVAETVAAK